MADKWYDGMLLQILRMNRGVGAFTWKVCSTTAAEAEDEDSATSNRVQTAAKTSLAIAPEVDAENHPGTRQIVRARREMEETSERS